MIFTGYKSNRVRNANSRPLNQSGEYILYWMQAFRRLASNHSLDFAIELSKSLKKPLVVYEGLRKDYPWNSERIHKFVIEGMCDNALDAKNLNIPYWCFVETDENPARGLIKKISENAVAIVTDDFPCFIIPEQIQKLASKVNCAVYAIDGNGIIPLKLYGEFANAARIVRIRMHKLFSDAYCFKAKQIYTSSDLKDLPRKKNFFNPPFHAFTGKQEDIPKIIQNITFHNKVESYPLVRGGRKAGLEILRNFVDLKLKNYANERSIPNSPEKTAASLLSPYLHFGHVSAEEVVTYVLDSSVEGEKWTPEFLDFGQQGKRVFFFSKKDYINSYLDELITWRDTGYQWFWQKSEFRKGVSDLPNWALENFAKHRNDRREYSYSIDQLRYGMTHDPIWNAAQHELRITGRMHNYMRMLWGKKVIEWSSSIEEAFSILEEFNNLYAYDGRNPNSYTGILWCFGMFDRPWFPERNVFGNVRYMSSDSIYKKFKMDSYLNYINQIYGRQETLF